MATRLLVLGAGTGPSNNLIRSLRAGRRPYRIVGCHDDRFMLRKSSADHNYLVPNSSQPAFLDAICSVIESERIDLLIPDSDPDVKAVSVLRDRIPCRVFLPANEVIDLCQDKYALTMFLRERGIPAPLTFPVSSIDEIDEIFLRLARNSRLWCRIRTGQGSAGALPVESAEQARSWIKYWEAIRGVPVTSFTISEYLPGRDYSLQCLWNEGKLVLSKMSERLAYFNPGNSPSGMSSTPALAKTVLEPQVADVCSSAIAAVDPRASGIFCFDLKERADGTPCVTEINAGRFAMITNIYDMVGRHNMAVTYVRIAMGETVKIRNVHDFAADHYLVRDMDTLPDIYEANELFEGITDAR